MLPWTKIIQTSLGRSHSHQNLPEDQCIFIRGFRVARTLRIFPKHLVAAAGPSSDPDEDNHEPEPDMRLTSLPTITKVKWQSHPFRHANPQRGPQSTEIPFTCFWNMSLK